MLISLFLISTPPIFKKMEVASLYLISSVMGIGFLQQIEWGNLHMKCVESSANIFRYSSFIDIVFRNRKGEAASQICSEACLIPCQGYFYPSYYKPWIIKIYNRNASKP